MPRMRKIADIKAEIEKETNALKVAREREAHRVGMMALEAGIEDLDVSERDLREGFKELAARFRQGS